LRDYSEHNRLGVEVVDVALINLHPPIEAAADYLDVISAQIDARRLAIEAEGERQARLERSSAESAAEVSGAKVEAARRIAKAIEESTEFVSLGQALAAAPDAFRERLWFDMLEKALADKRVYLIDEPLEGATGETILDLRPTARRDFPVPSGGK
jgi:regulator of protease activity HflC (stomatin/prohibitin superfamily)